MKLTHNDYDPQAAIALLKELRGDAYRLAGAYAEAQLKDLHRRMAALESSTRETGNHCFDSWNGEG